LSRHRQRSSKSYAISGVKQCCFVKNIWQQISRRRHSILNIYMYTYIYIFMYLLKPNIF
jgi:hypothetical protein